MKRKILKGAGVLLIAAIMVLSVTAATANTNDKKSGPTPFTIDKVPFSSQILVWDNGMNYDGLASAQYDDNIQLDSFLADDFHFEEDKQVCEVHWIAGYWDGACAEFDWCVSFMNDDGTGNAPDSHPQDPSYAGPFCYTSEEIEKEDLGNQYYKMGVVLPENIPFEGCEKYWISIWGVGEYPPQSGWAYHWDQILLHQAVWGSDYFGTPFWTNSEDVLGDPVDTCFQLFMNESCSEICCEHDLVWDDPVKPGTILKGQFIVCNCGCECSTLCWLVKEWPQWGKYTFDPLAGSLHAPDCETVDVTLDTTGLEPGNYRGVVIVKNCMDNTDCEIDVIFTITKNLAIQLNMNSHPLFIRLMQRLQILNNNLAN